MARSKRIRPSQGLSAHDVDSCQDRRFPQNQARPKRRSLLFIAVVQLAPLEVRVTRWLCKEQAAYSASQGGQAICICLHSSSLCRFRATAGVGICRRICKSCPNLGGPVACDRMRQDVTCKLHAAASKLRNFGKVRFESQAEVPWRSSEFTALRAELLVPRCSMMLTGFHVSVWV